MDPLVEKYYGISPYAYCANDPVNRVDPDGMIDKEWLKKGGMTFGAGLLTTVGGGIAIASEVGAIPGAYAISTGIPSMGLGLGMIAIGLFTDPTPEGREKMEKTPTGVLNGFGKASDIVLGTENHEMEKIANMTDAIIGLGTLSKPQNIIESAINGFTIVHAADATKKVGEALQEKKSNENKTISQPIVYVVEKNWAEDLEESLLWRPLEYQY